MDSKKEFIKPARVEVTREDYFAAVEVVERYHKQVCLLISEADSMSNNDRPMVYRGDVIEIIGRTNSVTNKYLTVGSQHIVASEKATMSRERINRSGRKYCSVLVFNCRKNLFISRNYSYKIVKRKNEFELK